MIFTFKKLIEHVYKKSKWTCQIEVDDDNKLPNGAQFYLDFLSSDSTSNSNISSTCTFTKENNNKILTCNEINVIELRRIRLQVEKEKGSVTWKNEKQKFKSFPLTY